MRGDRGLPRAGATFEKKQPTASESSVQDVIQTGDAGFRVHALRLHSIPHSGRSCSLTARD